MSIYAETNESDMKNIMKHPDISGTMLAGDLLLCSLWLLCLIHGGSFGVRFDPWLLAVPLLKIWLSFLNHRRSRLALIPIVMLVLFVFMSFGRRANPAFVLFVEPWLIFFRTVSSVAGIEFFTVDNLQDIYNVAFRQRYVIALISSVWLVGVPLVIYMYYRLRKHHKPSSTGVWKGVGLSAYLWVTIIISSLVMTSLPERPVSIGVSCLLLMTIPMVFNRGSLRGMFTRQEAAFMQALFLMGTACSCGISYSNASVITTCMFPAAFYALSNWLFRRHSEYKDIAMMLAGGIVFWCAQYLAGMLRVMSMLVALAVMLIPFVRFAYKKKMFSGAAALYVLIACVLPVLCLGYNPYSVMEAGRRCHFEDYEYSPHGLMIVGGKYGIGIRDRYGIVIPAEYEDIEILVSSKPYCKVRKDGRWMIYDIERHKIAVEGCFDEILRSGEMTFILKSGDLSRCMVISDCYNRYKDEEPFMITAL